MSKTTTIEKVKQLNKQLLELRLELESSGVDDVDDDKTPIPKEITELIQVELCRFAKMVVPNIHQKIDEIIEKANLPEFVVSDKANGADLINSKTDSHREIKTSVLTKEARCNFMFNVPSGTTNENRTLLEQSIREKTKNDKAVFIIKNKKAKEIARYEFGCEFLVWYVGHFPSFSEKTTKINFGCSRCKKCKSFHRLDHLKSMEQQFNKKEKGQGFSKLENLLLFSEQPTNC
jgi:hypothetical protein